IAVVVTGSAAERAGIRVGDHLVAVDGKSITTDEGSRRFSELRAGDSTRLTLERAGKTLDVSIVLGVTRGGGRGGVANAASNDLPGFVTYTPDTRVEIWSDTRVVESTDSTGATILRIGNTKIRLAPTTPGAARTGRGLTGNGRRGFPP